MCSSRATERTSLARVLGAYAKWPPRLTWQLADCSHKLNFLKVRTSSSLEIDIAARVCACTATCFLLSCATNCQDALLADDTRDARAKLAEFEQGEACRSRQD